MARSLFVALSVLLGVLVHTAVPNSFVAVANAADVFRHKGLDGDAKRFETWLKANWKPGQRKVSRLVSTGNKLMRRDPRGASRQFATAVVSALDNRTAWAGLSRSLLAIPAKQLSGSERYRTPVNASAAAYRAYQLANGNDQKAASLVLLSQALQRRSFWRPAIETLRLSLVHRDTPQVRASYDALLTQHGFRMTNYRVETETSRPRVCIEFSEAVKRGDIDFAKFLSVNGQVPGTVKAAGRNLCIDGFSHGETYEVLLRSGLPSQVGEALAKNVELGVYVRDRSPTVRFSGRAYVLPSIGQRGLPVVSINTEEVGVEIFRIGDRNLVSAVADGEVKRQLSRWELNDLRNKKGAQVYKGVLKVRRELNKEVTTAVPVGDAVKTLQPGVYAAVAWGDAKAYKDGGNLATQWFIVSDIGLTAYTGPDGVHVFARSLATADPAEAVAVKLLARNNEVLAETKTTAAGYARFDAGHAKGEGGLKPALLVATTVKGDYAFLDMASGAFDLSDRGVKGRTAPGPIDGFMYLDRGVYRPGENVQLSALVRDAKAASVDVPVTLVVARPDGVEHKRINLAGADIGGHTFTLAVPAGAMTGTWRLALHTDPKADPIARAAYLVEDFVPERLSMELGAVRDYIAPSAPGAVTVAGKYLYGPPAADLALGGEVIVKVAKGLKAYPGFQFGRADQQVTPTRGEIVNAGRTDAQGRAEVAVSLPKIARTARPLEARVLLRLQEAGGRSIERQVTMPVRTGNARLGVKKLFDGNVGDGEPASFEVIAIDGANQRTALAGIRWELVRLERSWQWYKRGGSWAYEAVTIPSKVADGVFDIDAQQAIRISERLNWGRYRLDVRAKVGAQTVSSVYFNAGWYASDDVDSPEMLPVALDKPSYAAGDSAKLKITARQPGTAMIAIISGGLVSARDVYLPAGDSEVELPVGENWGTGAYVVATHYRELDQASKRMPGRALGIAWLGIDQDVRRLKVGLAAPEKVQSGTTLEVPVTIEGLETGQSARLTVAAVDVGVLNLTRFASPAPSKWFYAQPKLGTEIRDLYGRLIDGMRAERGSLKSGGDADGSLGMQGSPPVEETIALFSGIVQVNADGKATVKFDMPDFNGAVRLMAVAWSSTRVGEASQSVIVRDKIAVTASMPRFLTLGDTARVRVDLHNIELPDATPLSVRIAQTYATGEPTEIHSSDVTLDKGARQSVHIDVSPKQLGQVTYDLFVTGPDGLDVKRDYIFDVKAPAGDVRRTVRQEVGGGASVRLGRELLADLIPGDVQVSMSVGPGAGLDVPALLTQLDRYPYGCAEQTISRALPLLYVNDLATGSGMTADAEMRKRIETSIARVFGMQDSSGAFGVWGPSNADIWLTAYVTDFLTRAREKGYAVDQRGFTQALSRLQNYVSYAADFKVGGEKRAYALYVLARNGQAPIGELRYYADARLKRFATPIAKAQLAAALAMAGDTTRADTVFDSAFADLGDLGRETTRADFGSGLRDAAAVLTLASESGRARARARVLTDKLAAAYAGRQFTSTQEQAWLLLAARGLSEEAAQLKVSLNGNAHVGGRLSGPMSSFSSTDGGLVLANAGPESAPAVVTVVGRSLKPQAATENGLSVTRQYFTLDGRKVDLGGDTSTLNQTDRLVAVLTVSMKEAGGRLLLVDRLPAGLEIENPRLIGSGDVKALSWLNSPWAPDHTEFRDDRFVAAFDFFRAGNKMRVASVAYIVRAVTPGSFVHPAATVEDMYRPSRHARTAAGRLTVAAQ